MGKNKKSKSEEEKIAGAFYGTKKDMVLREFKKPFMLFKNSAGYDYKINIVARDEKGYYGTVREYVGSGLLDPFRINYRPNVPLKIIAEIEREAEEKKKKEAENKPEAENNSIEA